MSTTVVSITDQVNAICADTLGGNWHQLPHAYSLELNDLRMATKGYGVVSLAASSTTTLTNYYTLDHTFELILTDCTARTRDESDAAEVIGLLYDKQDEVLKQMILTKLNLAGTVLLVNPSGMSEPDFIGSDRRVIALRQQFIVKYRQAIA